MKRHTPNGGSLESSVGTLVRGASDNLHHRYAECEEQVRKSPSSALLCAVAVGYLLRNLPIAALVSGVMRLLLALVRPAAFLFIAAKLFEILQREAKKSARTNPPFPT